MYLACYKMYKEKLIAQIKLHPFATGLYAAYMTFWITVYYLLFFGGAKIGEVMLCGFYLSIPYSLITLSLTLLTKKSRRFYLWLTYLIFLPIIVTMRMIVLLL